MRASTQSRLERLEQRTQAQRQADAPWFVAGLTEEDVEQQLAELRAAGVDTSRIKCYIGIDPDWR